MCNKKEEIVHMCYLNYRFMRVTNKSIEIEYEILYGAISCTWSALSLHQVLFTSQQSDMLTIQISIILLDQFKVYIICTLTASSLHKENKIKYNIGNNTNWHAGLIPIHLDNGPYEFYQEIPVKIIWINITSLPKS
jgi:hypothetical protein